MRVKLLQGKVHPEDAIKEGEPALLGTLVGSHRAAKGVLVGQVGGEVNGAVDDNAGIALGEPGGLTPGFWRQAEGDSPGRQTRDGHGKDSQGVEKPVWLDRSYYS